MRRFEPAHAGRVDEREARAQDLAVQVDLDGADVGGPGAGGLGGVRAHVARDLLQGDGYDLVASAVGPAAVHLGGGVFAEAHDEGHGGDVVLVGGADDGLEDG